MEYSATIADNIWPNRNGRNSIRTTQNYDGI